MESIVAFFRDLGAWNWLILALALFLLETVIPGVHFVWFGLAAVLVAVVGLSVDMPWQFQAILFAVLSVASLFVMTRWAKSTDANSDEPHLNVRGSSYVGRTVTVAQAITGGRGKVRVGDTLWSAEGPDLSEGATAKVVAVSGTVLVVEPQ
ncbi:MAG: NfeD family protein [Pseudomonadota bacterium]